jgi:mannose-6-phosphate isomerase-like protein (cupin superfamily)
MDIQKVSLSEKFDQIRDYWNPRIAGELNGQMVKLAKVSGEFIWHKHEAEDEMFLVIEGEMEIQLPDKKIYLKAGEFVIIPRGVEHKPVAKTEVKILLFEPATTVNTGATQSKLTKTRLEKI